MEGHEMGGLLVFLYGLISYLFFLIAFSYAIGFVGNYLVPKGIDSGTDGPIVPAIITGTTTQSPSGTS